MSDRPRAQNLELEKNMHDDDKTLARVAPSVPCVAPTGSTAESQSGTVTAAERTDEHGRRYIELPAGVGRYETKPERIYLRESRSPDGDGPELPSRRSGQAESKEPRHNARIAGEPEEEQRGQQTAGDQGRGGQPMTVNAGDGPCYSGPRHTNAPRLAVQGAGSEPADSLQSRGAELEKALRLRLPLDIPQDANTVRDLVADLKAARAQITALVQEKADTTIEYLRAILHHTLKGYTAAEQVWRTRAESAEAQVAALTVQLQEERADIARANGLLEAYYNPNFGPELPDANVWYVAQCVVEHIHALDAEVAALTVERERLQKENQELKKEHDDALTRVDRQGVISDDSVPQGRTRGEAND